uniref:Uncharacterized protein n=1 Tax=Ciona intestinalis TaxID=7719 RepID=F6SD34_CIOIN
MQKLGATRFEGWGQKFILNRKQFRGKMDFLRLFERLESPLPTKGAHIFKDKFLHISIVA